jgi:hypothetical protein
MVKYYISLAMKSIWHFGYFLLVRPVGLEQNSPYKKSLIW